MDVNELREALLLLPGNMPVILSKDPEGNKFHYLSDVEVSFIDSENDLDPVHPDDEEDHGCEDGDPQGLYLWP